MIAMKCMASRDCYLVAAIYRAMGGKTYDLYACCRIPGAICDSYNNVVEIRWKDHDLKGLIPLEIGELRHLRFL